MEDKRSEVKLTAMNKKIDDVKDDTNNVKDEMIRKQER